MAFLVLPWVAPRGSPGLFVAITALWAATSAALRAPPLTLLGRYVAKPAVPWLVSLVLLGTGIASAIGPYLGLTLKGLDPVSYTHLDVYKRQAPACRWPTTAPPAGPRPPRARLAPRRRRACPVSYTHLGQCLVGKRSIGLQQIQQAQIGGVKIHLEILAP